MKKESSPSEARQRIAGVYLMIEVDASEIFKSSYEDFEFCLKNVGLSNKESGDFLMYCGGSLRDFQRTLQNMAKGRCSQSFISQIKHARAEGAMWVLLRSS